MRATVEGRTGRRPGNPDTRRAILLAARHAFAGKGFAGASIRRIAADAGCDPALVHHYFGTKEELFVATVEVPVNPADIIDALVADGLDGLGDRLIRAVLSVWESPAGTALAAVLRSALADPDGQRAFPEFVSTVLIGKVRTLLDGPAAAADLRLALVAAQLSGVMIGRYLLRLAPLSTVPVDDLAAAVGPVLQGYLTGELPRSAR